MVLNEQLKQGVIARDRKAQLELYRLCFGLSTNIACRYKKNREDQQTIVNNAFMKIINNLHKYEEQNNFHSWVKRIIMNEVVDDFRKGRSYNNLISQEVYPIENIYIEQYTDVDYHYSEQELLAMMSKLPKATKLVFNMFAIDGYSHKEICVKLGIGLETSKWHVKQARKLLKNMLLKKLANQM